MRMVWGRERRGGKAQGEPWGPQTSDSHVLSSKCHSTMTRPCPHQEEHSAVLGVHVFAGKRIVVVYYNTIPLCYSLSYLMCYIYHVLVTIIIHTASMLYKTSFTCDCIRFESYTKRAECPLPIPSSRAGVPTLWDLAGLSVVGTGGRCLAEVRPWQGRTL